jgi:hypothetical protein
MIIDLSLSSHGLASRPSYHICVIFMFHTNAFPQGRVEKSCHIAAA